MGLPTCDKTSDAGDLCVTTVLPVRQKVTCTWPVTKLSSPCQHLLMTVLVSTEFESLLWVQSVTWQHNQVGSRLQPTKPVSPSARPSVHQSVSQSVSQSVCPSVHQSVSYSPNHAVSQLSQSATQLVSRSVSQLNSTICFKMFLQGSPYQVITGNIYHL